MQTFTVSGRLQKFPGKAGWFFVPVPLQFTKQLPKIKWGLYPAELSINDTHWQSSLMPFGPKAPSPSSATHFIAIPAKVRRAKGVDEGSKVKVGVKV